MRRVIIAIAALALSGHAGATGDAGYTRIMDDWCRVADGTSQNSLKCAQYFAGALHMSIFMEYTAANEGFQTPFCAGDADPSPDILRRLWVNYIDDNPKLLAEPIFVSYIRMMKQEYPCAE